MQVEYDTRVTPPTSGTAEPHFEFTPVTTSKTDPDFKGKIRFILMCNEGIYIPFSQIKLSVVELYKQAVFFIITL